MQEHALGAADVVAHLGFHRAAAKLQAAGGGHADALAGGADEVRKEADRGGLAAGAGDADERDAAVFARGKEHVDDGLAHRAHLAHGGLQVHEQARAGVDFDDGTVLLFQRAGDVFAHHVDAGDVEAHHTGGGDHVVADGRVDGVGDVDGPVGEAGDDHPFARTGEGGGGLALQAQLGEH